MENYDIALHPSHSGSVTALYIHTKECQVSVFSVRNMAV